MASEDWFLRLDPYNFDTEEEYMRFHYPEFFEDVEFVSGDDNKPNSLKARLESTGLERSTLNRSN